ncbi:MAG: zf-HC2 domain-containing protein [Pyrinomonadaceae bacterium]
MNCEKCQDLLSDLLDDALSPEDQSTLNAHLEECLSCFAVRDELNSIVSFCRDCRGEYVAPPNERAMWLRIRNTVENERTVAAAATAGRSAREVALAGGESWWSRLMNRSWELSLSQMTGAVAAIAVAVALVTAFSMQRMQQSADGTSASARTNITSASAASTAITSNVDDRMRQQQLAIDYWNQRIAERKARWSPQMREAFDRNMGVIDQAVNYSRDELRRNPHDEVSEEMLNSALNDKMELLREFADL